MEDEWGSRNNWLEISFPKGRGKVERGEIWILGKIRDSTDLSRSESLSFFYFRQSGANAARSGFDIGRRTNEVEFRSIRNWICHGLCVPGFLERPPPSMLVATPFPHSRLVKLRNRWMGHVETIRASRARKRGEKNKRGSLSYRYFNAEISKIFARVFSFFLEIFETYSPKTFLKIKFKLSSETRYFLRK